MATAVEAIRAGVSVQTRSGRRPTGARVLVATGRRAYTDELNLSAAGVRIDDRGFVIVNEAQRTSNPRVYAAGDVSGAPQYVYVAAATGRVAALNALEINDSCARLDYRGLPAVVFTRPQLASAELTEAEALERGHRCDCRVLDLSDVPRALVEHDTRGALMLVADGTTGKVLGVHALADDAGETMLAATYALRAGMTVDDVADAWAPT